MNFFIRIKNFIFRLLKKDNTKKIESAKTDSNTNYNKNFQESLKIKTNSKYTENKETVIETLQCENDGLGFQKIKNY